MIAKLTSEGVYLEYQLERNEHGSFLKQRKKQEAAGLKCESFNGGDKENSWIKTEKWLE